MAYSWDQAQYATIKPLLQSGEVPLWVPEEHRERIGAYTKYEQIYWSANEAFRLMRRGSELQPIYVPNGKTIVDNTAHYLLKDLSLVPQGSGPVDASAMSLAYGRQAADDQPKGRAAKSVDAVLRRYLREQRVISKIAVGKHVGVVHGDWVIHLTADETKPEGKRVKFTVIDPARWFPLYEDSTDLDELTGVVLAETFKDSDGKLAIRKLTYRLESIGGEPRVSMRQVVYEPDTESRWFNDVRPIVKRVEIDEGTLLPPEITSIPVYPLKNADWTGQVFGSSELRGYERLMEAVNQTTSDTELALSLEGLGVYATDAGTPTDDNGNLVAWEIAPGKVMELPVGAFFNRVKGLESLDPVLEFQKYLETHMAKSSSTFLAGDVEVAVAQSGIALEIRFLPTLAKISERDLEGIDVLSQTWSDWCGWMDAYEGTSIAGSQIDVVLGSKLPIDRKERQAELNNMLDRQVISRKFYRMEMSKLGYNFPTDRVMEQQISDEEEMLAQFALMGQIPEPTSGDGTTGGAVGRNNGKGLAGGDPTNPNAPTKSGSTTIKAGQRSNESGGSEAGRSGPSRGSTNGAAK